MNADGVVDPPEKAQSRSALGSPKNRLLASLPSEVFERIQTRLTQVSLEWNDIMYRAGDRLPYVYFPNDAVVAKVCLSEEGKATATGMVGREGIVGLSSFLSGFEAAAEVQVIQAGTALRLDSRTLDEEFSRGGLFQKAMLHFTHAYIAQTGQIAVCNRHHAIDQQLCFWLLLFSERAMTRELRITQEMLASLLGVRREGITLAALKLKEEGILDYKRGRVIVLNREHMEKRTCECYHIVRNAYGSLLR